MNMTNLNELFKEVPIKTLGDVDKLLILADQTLQEGRRSAAVISIAHMRILSAGLSLTFRYLEGRYRFLHSDTYLLAPSSDQLPDHLKSFSVPSSKPAAYWIWICVNGEREAVQAMQRYQISDSEENLTRLETTGFLRQVGPPP